MLPKPPLLEGQLSVLVRVKCPGNDVATFLPSEMAIEILPTFLVTFVTPEYSFDIVVQILILKDVAAQLLKDKVKVEHA